MAANEQYPPLSLLVSTTQLPQFVQGFIEEHIQSIRYKDYYPEKSQLGDSASYAITLLLERPLKKPLFADIYIVVNPADGGKSQIPLYIGYNLEIVKYIKQLTPNKFAENPRQYMTVLFEMLGIPTQQLMESVLSTFIESEDPLQAFIDKYNEDYDPITPLTKNSGHAENEYLDVALQLAEDEVDVFDILLDDYITQVSLSETKERIQDLFSEWYGDFSLSDLLQKLLIPHITAGLNDLTLALEFPQKWLKPIDAKGKVIEGEASQLRFTAGSVSFDSETGLNFAQQSNLSFTKSQIGNTGFTLSFDNAKIDFSRSENISEATAAGYPSDFVGVYVEEAEIGLPDGWKVNEESSSAKIVGRDILIGTGGFSGTIGLEAKEGEENPLLSCKFGNWEAELTSVSVTFLQNSIVESDIRGTLILPDKFKQNGLEGKISITINIREDGEFDIVADAGTGFPLQFFKNNPFFTLQVKSLGIGRDEGEFYIGTSGTISFKGSKLENVIHGDIEISGLKIWSDGTTELSGGSLPLGDGVCLQLGPAKIMVTSIMHGSIEKKRNGEVVKYKYWGFDGGVDINPGGVDARGTGIKYCYQCDGKGNDSYISMESLGIDITIPGNATPEQATVIIKGWLSVTQEKLQIEPGNENPAEATVYGGGISLTLPKLRLGATVNMKYTPDVPAWIVEAGLKLPNPILLGATGLGIYGFSGIFGRRYNTSKTAAGVSENATWYDYYQADPRGVSLPKFSYPTQTQNSDKAFSAGVGMLLATASDGGKTFSSRVLLLLSLPNVFMIEGKARIMGEMVGFNDTKEPPFYAFIAISDESVEAGFGAHMKIPEDTGNLLKIDGDAELGYYFSNPKGWKINIGSDTKPITAEFVRLFRSEAYLMLSAKGIRTEVSTRLSFNKKYLKGALKAYIDAYMRAGGAISFEKPQMSGYGAVGGRCGVSIFKFGFDLSFDAGLCIEAVRPLLIEGSVGLSVGIKILRRRVSKSFTVEFRWETRGDLDASKITLLSNNGVIARNMMSDELFNVCCVESGGPLSYPMIPMDSYIDIKFLKPLNPKSSMSVLGSVSEAEGYTECIPPNANKRYVRHTYSLDGIKIECSTDENNWTEYHPYKAAAETVGNDFPKEIGHWQLSAAGIYDTIRLLALSPFSYLDKGLKEWVRPEQYGITGSTLYCVGNGTYWSKADFSGKTAGRISVNGVLNSRTKSGQSVGYVVKNTAKIVANSDGYHDVSKCLETNEGSNLTLKFSSPVRHVKLHASCAGAVTFTFEKTTYDEEGKGTTTWTAPVIKQGSDFLQPVDYESEECFDTVKIGVSKTAREELRKQIQLQKERLYAGDYTTTREAMVAEIMTLVSQYETLQSIDSSSVTSKIQTLQGELTSQTATRTQAEEAKSAIEQLMSEAQGLINVCCLESPTNEPTDEDACIARLETIANSVSDNQDVQDAINVYKQNLATLKNNKETAKTQFGENYASLRSSGQSYLQALQAEQSRLTATIVSCRLKEEELLQTISEVETATAAQQGTEALGFGDKFRLYEIEWQTFADYEAEKNLPSKQEIESAYRAKVEAMKHQIQPIWRPYTKYKVTVNVSDNRIRNCGNPPQLSDTQTYYIGFQTGGPVGYFHEDYDATVVNNDEKYVKVPVVATEQETPSEDTVETDSMLDEGSILQRYPLATLKDYIDYNRSYPNADGNLLNAKPLYYNDCELKLRYKYGFVQNMFRNWNEYDTKVKNVLPSHSGSLYAMVKDPREEEFSSNPLDEHVETRFIPRTIVDWEDDESAKVPNGVKAEDVLRNPSLYNNEYASTNWECWEVGGKKIRPAHKETTISMEGLRPNTLYTAIFYNDFNSERREVHRYVFQTSRYGNLAEQIGSYRQTAANGETAEAVQDFQHRVSETEMRDIRSIVSYRRLANKTNNLFDTYSDPFDCMMEGVLGMPPQEKPEQLEINRVRNEKGNIIGILLRSPEPLIDPKIPDKERFGFCSLIVQQLATSLTYNRNYLYSKDCSQLFITTDSFKLSGKSFHLEFKPIEWTGTEYKAMEDSVVTGEIKME